MVANFDPSVSKEQKAAMADILGQLYPIPWQKKGMDTVAFYLGCGHQDRRGAREDGEWKGRSGAGAGCRK